MGRNEASLLALDPAEAVAAEARALEAQHGNASTEEILRVALDLYGDRIGLVSSFGADSAVLLHIVAKIDPHVPVIFVDTRKHFAETLSYRDELAGRLGLTDVRSVTPEPEDIAAADADGALWLRDNDRCCHIRKVMPLARALKGFDAWISGRKRFQSAGRSILPAFEPEEGRIKINPLAAWSAADIIAHMKEHDLPRHPLVAKGYPSIGCMPCTDKVAEGEDPRAGRWRGQDKTECGIHFALPGENEDGAGI
ncbi:phosphoadenylyl-sulfate reductase [Stappia sp. GBMRC 2046]|uniref:Adenosine 5'-phosphosulfate reductase n=1 Tax=Stappia sediminis TaxID=2692190 RepID=A0A7X3LWC0_9HYPH|nr:phosphoadenylyl-sulfate reductase [Stappia sediminis]MXN66261.1 phosphoadenylyl-sulfate reductase [Stappia sediminis]